MVRRCFSNGRSRPLGPRQTLRIRRRDRDRAGRARRDLPESMDAVDRVKVRSGKGLLTIGRRLFPGPCLLKPFWIPCQSPVGIGRLSGSVGNRASGSAARRDDEKFSCRSAPGLSPVFPCAIAGRSAFRQFAPAAVSNGFVRKDDRMLPCAKRIRYRSFYVRRSRSATAGHAPD